MTIEDRLSIISNDYANAFVEYNRNDSFMQQYKDYFLNIIDEKYGVIYFPQKDIAQHIQKEYGYALIPKLFGLLDNEIEEIGINKIRNIPKTDFRGNGVLMGFVDTGIDYTNNIFKNSDNTTRIISIWDQTIENMEADESISFFGKEYLRDEINNALKSDNPYSIVPSKDDVGHGTMLAGIAGGSEQGNFQGVAPLSEFIIVKLKPAKKYLKDYFFIPDNAICYQEDDIMLGIKYLIRKASLINRPIAICIGLGTNQGPHDGSLPISLYISDVGSYIGRVFLVAAGNEGSGRRHYFGTINPNLGYDLMEINVGEGERGFSMEIWGNAPYIYAIDIQSPSGEYIPKIASRFGESRKIRFLFEQTTVYIDYLLVEYLSGDPMIFLRFAAPAPGVWKIRVYAKQKGNVGFHSWLPLTGFISDNTFFNNSNPDTTITSPGNTLSVPTITAYDSSNGSIYLKASRGFTRYGYIKPTVAAPGVNVLVPYPDNSFLSASGTSIAAAYATGVAVILFEWGIVNGNYISISSLQIQHFFIRGAVTEPDNNYPNNIWGFGKLNIYNTFLSLRSE